MKIYISAPITGYDLDERRKYFASIAEFLKSKHHVPVNPIESECGDETHEECMHRDIKLLLPVFLWRATQASFSGQIQHV